MKKANFQYIIENNKSKSDISEEMLALKSNQNLQAPYHTISDLDDTFHPKSAYGFQAKLTYPYQVAY